MKYLMCVLMLCAFGCTKDLKKEAVHVKITYNPETIKGFKYIAEIKSVSAMIGFVLSESGKISCENQLKNQAHALGGDYVLVLSSDTYDGARRMIGAVYLSNVKVNLTNKNEGEKK